VFALFLGLKTTGTWRLLKSGAVGALGGEAKLLSVSLALSLGTVAAVTVATVVDQ